MIKSDPLEPPGLSNEEVLEWLFVVDVLNFCFWSDEPTLFTVWHLGHKWTGYRSMCAALARAKSEGVPVHKPEFYGSVTQEEMEHIFRSDSHVELPLLKKRRSNLHEAAAVLYEVGPSTCFVVQHRLQVFMKCHGIPWTPVCLL